MTVKNSFDKKIFWDVDTEKLDWHQHSQFIIERVLIRGFIKDVKKIFSVYTKEELTKATINSKTLDRKTANFMSIYLNIPIENIHAAPEYY
jgi:hypothetical protein